MHSESELPSAFTNIDTARKLLGRIPRLSDYSDHLYELASASTLVDKAASAIHQELVSVTIRVHLNNLRAQAGRRG